MKDSPAVRYLILLGAISVVLAAGPYRLFDLDRFLAPKELVLHAFALTLALLGLRRAAALEFGRTDLLLGGYLALSLVSALFAGDHWLSWRALAITLSGAGVFWVSRAEGERGARRAIVSAAAAAAVLGAAVSLAQAYGFTSDFFSLNRVPGGTLGNRNFMAHLAAVCAPALILAALGARRRWSAAAWTIGLAVLADALVLSRSRAAYLGLAAGAALICFGVWRARGRWQAPQASLRLKALTLAAALGVLGALLIPNKLEWKSDSPYLDTVTGIVNYQKGSGHGRLVQYGRTLRLAAAHPLLGIGPGNWAVVYPKSVDGYDPSIDYHAGTTLNPWPSSDWVAIAAERGAPALLALLLALGGLLAGAWRRCSTAADLDGYMEGLALAAVLAVTVIVAGFDAVLLLAAPSFIIWALLGALAAPEPALGAVELAPRARRWFTVSVALLGAAAVLRSSGQVAAMGLYGRARTMAQFTFASRLDPSNVRIRARLKAIQARKNARAAAHEDRPQQEEPEEPALVPGETGGEADGAGPEESSPGEEVIR